MGALADQALLVVGGHLQLDTLAVHQGDLTLGPHLDADRGGGVVAHTQLGAHGALAGLQVWGDGLPGGLLHQGAHKRGAKDGQSAGAGGLGGIRLAHHSLGAALHSNFNGHIGHFSFVDSICPVGTSYFTPLFNKKLVSCPNFVQRVEDCPVLWEGAHQIPVAHAVQLQLRGHRYL